MLVDLDVRGQQEMVFSQKKTFLWIIDSYFDKKQWFKVQIT